MAYVCLECGEIYTERMERCPKASCYGEVAEVDELMIPTIIKLNDKGYITDYCCSGHFYDKCSSPYIMFSDFIFEIFDEEDIEKLFESLPEPWYIDEYDMENGHFCIRARMLDGMDDIKAFEYITDLNVELLEFVDALPFIG
jgi:hypothetical protein